MGTKLPHGRITAHRVAIGLLVGGAAAVSLAMLPALGTTRTVLGVAQDLAIHPGKGATDYVVRLADGRSFTWRCGSRSCAASEAALADREVRWSLPAPAEITLRRRTVIGLEIAGSRLLSPDVETARRQGDILGVALLIGVAAGGGSLLLAREQAPAPKRRRAARKVLP